MQFECKKIIWTVARKKIVFMNWNKVMQSQWKKNQFCIAENDDAQICMKKSHNNIQKKTYFNQPHSHKSNEVRSENNI